MTRFLAAGAEVGQVRRVGSRVQGGDHTGHEHCFSLTGFEVVESAFLCDSGMKT